VKYQLGLIMVTRARFQLQATKHRKNKVKHWFIMTGGPGVGQPGLEVVIGEEPAGAKVDHLGQESKEAGNESPICSEAPARGH
jgi:hypothetical protein